jgi:hypothetical protein
MLCLLGFFYMEKRLNKCDNSKNKAYPMKNHTFTLEKASKTPKKSKLKQAYTLSTPQKVNYVDTFTRHSRYFDLFLQ